MALDRRELLGSLMVLGGAASVTASAAAEAVPSRPVFPLPETASPQLQALIVERKSNVAWKMVPKDAAEWRAIVKASTAEIEMRDAPWAEKYGVTIREDRLGGVPVYWVTPKQSPAHNHHRVLLNFHGGAYVYARGRAGLEDAILMAGRGGFRVLSVDYRMAPDFPYPAAIDDAEAVWRELIKTTKPKHIGVFGTSTGGGITLALIHRCKKKGCRCRALCGLARRGLISARWATAISPMNSSIPGWFLMTAALVPRRRFMPMVMTCATRKFRRSMAIMRVSRRPI
jgi:acetyl esterase/lipase